MVGPSEADAPHWRGPDAPQPKGCPDVGETGGAGGAKSDWPW